MISVTGNGGSGAMRRLCDVARGGGVEAERVDAICRPAQNLFCESNDPGEMGRSKMGLIGPGIRLPLIPLAPHIIRW